MDKTAFSIVLLAVMPGFVLAQENSPLREGAARQAQARPDSLPVLQKLNQERQPQGAKSAPAAVPQGGAEKKEEAAAEELDLGTVSIQAVIEKPNVDIIPKRTEPDWEEMRFLERSFGRELKEVPEELMLIDEELDRAQKLEMLKKAGPPEEEKNK